MTPLLAFDLLHSFTLEDGSLLMLPTAVIALIGMILISAILCGCFLRVQTSGSIRLVKELGARERDSFEALSEDLTEIRPGRTPRGTAGRILDAIKQAGSLPTIEAIRDTVSQAAVREEARFSSVFLAFAVGSVLILGLGGTFLAFGELVHRSGLGKGSFEAGLPFVIKNLNLAFIASVTGVGASIILHFISAVLVKPRRNVLLADLEDLLVRTGMRSHGTLQATRGAVSPAGNKDLASTLEELAGKLSLAVGAITTVAGRLESLSASTPESMADTLEAIRKELIDGGSRYQALIEASTQTRDAIGGLADRSAAAIEEVLTNHAKRQLEIYEQASGFSSRLLDQIAEGDKARILTYQQGIIDINGKMSGVVDGWKAEAQNLVTAFREERSAYVEQLENAGKESIERLEKAAKESYQSVDRISETIADSCKAVAAEAVGRLEQSYQAQVNDWAKATEIAGQQREAVARTLALFDSQLSPLSAKIGNLNLEAENTLRAAGDAARGISELPSRFQELVNGCSEGIEILSGATASLGEGVDRMRKDADGAISKAGERLDKVSVQLGQVIELGRQGGYRVEPSIVSRMMRGARQMFQRKN